MGLMGKSKNNNMAARMAKASQSNPIPVTLASNPMDKRMPEVRVKQAHNGGFIVSLMGPEGYGSEKEHTYPKLSGVLSCMKEHFDTEAGETDTKQKETAEGE